MSCENKKLFAGVAVLVGVVIGVALVSAGVSVVHWSGSTEFCGSFCHTMDAAYASYKQGLHYKTASGATATCVDCHLKYESKHSISQAEVVGLLWHKAVSGSNSLMGQIKGTINTPEKEEARRPILTEHYLEWARSVDWLTCKGCHNLQQMSNPKNPLIGELHRGMEKEGKADCYSCHPTAGHNHAKLQAVSQNQQQ